MQNQKRENLKAIPQIIYEDDVLAVVNKPFGMVVNRSETIKSEDTLQDWSEKNINPYTTQTEANKYSWGDSFSSRAGIVHRIDRETSGIVLIAKSEKAFKVLQNQFYERIVKKEYTALVYGMIKEFENSERISVDAPVGRNPRNREKFAIVEGGREAVTVFELIEYIRGTYGDFTLVKCFPKTGRTHQIRVHLTALGYPVAGDKLYSGKKRVKTDSLLFNRQMLHACSITFIHPETKTEIHFSSNLPQDFKEVLSKIK